MAQVPGSRPVPKEEIESRHTRLQEVMKAAGMNGALFFQNADLIYLCGTTQVEAVYLPAQGTGLFLARPALARAAEEIPWADPVPMPRFEALAGLLAERTPGGLDHLGLELDVLPVSVYRRLKNKAFPGLDLLDASPLIRQIRTGKSEFEIDRMRAAATDQNAAFETIPEILAQGVTELELEARLTLQMRRRGHHGIIRFRGFGNEIFFGHVLSGPNGLVSAKIGSPTGGRGVGPGLGHGAGHRRIGEDELVSVDLCGGKDGYIMDQTRIFFTGRVPDLVRKTYENLLVLLGTLEAEIRPGAGTGAIYARSFELAEALGLSEGYMGLGREKCPFIGHGVGLELDELPVLARGGMDTMEAGMTFALEPRVFLPEYGVVGIEDTYVLTEAGPSPITRSDRALKEVHLEK